MKELREQCSVTLKISEVILIAHDFIIRGSSFIIGSLTGVVIPIVVVGFFIDQC